MKEKVSIFIEYIWLGASILSIIAGIHKTYHHGINQSWMFFVISVVALLMFFFRKHLRKKEKLSDKE